MGFRYGTSAAALNSKVVCTPNASGYFSTTLTGLAKGTTYYYAPYAVVGSTTFVAEEVQSFTTLSVSVNPVVAQSWPELPAEFESSYSNLHISTYYAGSERNYTIAYDKSLYTTYWVAYPLNSGHMGSLSRPGSWSYAPDLATTYQVDLTNHTYSTNNSNKGHSRGHLIPNASRNGNSTMQLQTFYVINSVPQIQNSFNDGIWSSLEGAVQSVAKSEEIYVVSGAALQTAGGSETISYTTAVDEPSKKVPVPNYFYKLVLKVEKSGSTVTAAKAVGFWFENKAYSGTDYASYTKSVNEIEELTGFNFFVNLPDTIEEAAESNSSWSTFTAF